MEVNAVAAEFFHDVPERVAVIQDRAAAGRFALVFQHDLRLQLAAPRDDFRQDRLVTGADLLDVLLQEIEKIRVQDHAVLHDLGQTRAVLPVVERPKRLRVHQNPFRLPEGADEVFPLRNIDAGFAADRTVHLGQQRGGDLNERQAAVERRRHETRQIAHDAASDRHDDGFPVRAALDEAFPEHRGHVHALAFLAGLHDAQIVIHAGVRKNFRDFQTVKRLDVGIGHDDRILRAFRPLEEIVAELIKNPAGNDDFVRIGTKRNGNGLHEIFPFYPMAGNVLSLKKEKFLRLNGPALPKITRPAETRSRGR